MKDYEKFFNRMEDFRIETRFYDNGESFEIEELYQAFKERIHFDTKGELTELREFRDKAFEAYPNIDIDIESLDT